MVNTQPASKRAGEMFRIENFQQLPFFYIHHAHKYADKLNIYIYLFCIQASATPLQRAAAEGHVDIVHQLLKHGADVNHQDVVVSL